MKKTLLLLLIAFVGIISGTAAPFVIKGVVFDASTQQTIPYATVSVSPANDSTKFVKRFATNLDGNFKEELSAAGHYMLTITSIGYNTYYKQFTLTEAKPTIDLGQLVMVESSDSLSEVVVVAQKPLVKVELDKLTYDMEADPDAKVYTTFDMLRKIPLVTIDGSDNIQVKGSSNFKIFINGKPSGMVTNNPSQALKSIPANTVKEIQVITEPGAKYDAEGVGGIINIITKNTMAGYMGSVRVGIDHYGSPNAGIYFSTKTGKFGLTANVNYGGYRNPGIESRSIREQYNAPNSAYQKQYSKQNSMSNYGFGNIEASYEMDSLDLFTLSFGGSLGGSNENSHGYSIIQNEQADTMVWYNNRDKNYTFWSSMNLSVNYQRSFKKPQKLLTASYMWDMSPNRQRATSYIDGLVNFDSYNTKNTSHANGNEHTFQLDYVEPFSAGKHTMEFGAKYILRDNNSHNKYYTGGMLLPGDSTESGWMLMPDAPNTNFKQMQHIVSGYGSYTFRYKIFSLRAGARLEYTMQQVDADTTFSSDYFNVIPNLLLGLRLGTASSLQLSYTQRIQRPGIWYLNPYRDDSNPLFIEQGNPDLKPTLSHEVTLQYGLYTQRFNLSTSLHTSYTDNAMCQIVSELNDSVLYKTYRNVGRNWSSGLSLYFSWTILPGIQIYANSNTSYLNMESQWENNNIRTEGWATSVYAGGQFQLPWKLRLGAYGGYGSPSIALQGKNASYYYYGLNLSRSFLKDKLDLSILAQNFAEMKQQYHGYVVGDSYRYDSYVKVPSARFMLTVSYRFGEMREQIKTISRVIKNDDVAGGQQGGQQGGASENK